MELDLTEARFVAHYVVPRLLAKLPMDMKMRLLKTGEEEDSMLARLVEQGSADIRWSIALVEQARQERRL